MALFLAVVLWLFPPVVCGTKRPPPPPAPYMGPTHHPPAWPPAFIGPPNAYRCLVLAGMAWDAKPGVNCGIWHKLSIPDRDAAWDACLAEPVPEGPQEPGPSCPGFVC